MIYLATIKEPRTRGNAYSIRLRRGHDRGRIVWEKGALTTAKAYELQNAMETAARKHGDDFERALQAGEVKL